MPTRKFRELVKAMPVERQHRIAHRSGRVWHRCPVGRNPDRSPQPREARRTAEGGLAVGENVLPEIEAEGPA